ncbi:LEAF RUST 10 DISEASE-RESISTANCE LOCUS RECEPTOR-LIKE PROTEIN KINASE-like 2.2 [Juglans regia]|uniref:LEAF RUST 10 DISEASE-RESISTANCE LOCUS RECEPTOR-LIKE PROTEIN KINASE-like 2.2 n=1 Tax=Juglans regia TaxID=51240 RepID=A0A6P9ETP4_JUGRE|nr:LEAF RUST 10 DISEASE-RESISTANCE LOCUS RECEPTOR-LIKE PROTEIN KINASE-like 2.2 [Juglans regia]
MAPKRYTYSDVKKLTKSFKDKVGQGGFGVVYKGKLPDGRIVAVKVLSKSKDNGKEFINEVASISRTSHVNIVSLLGECYERSKRALIYEFVPNGSLDSYGMLVLEMVGERKNIEGGTSRASEKYFSQGIYKKLEQGETLGTCDVTGDEEDIIKKMIIVNLWCIQTNPSDRPSIEKVIGMLEGSALQSLPFPPKPVLDSPLDSSTTSLSM